MSKATALIVIGAALLAGCLQRLDGSEGYRCDRDEHCDSPLICLQRTCRSRPANAPAFPWRLASYYGEYPHKWGANQDATHYLPTLGKYDSLAVLSDHLQAFAYGHLPIGLFNWWGPGTDNDEVWKQALAKTAGSPFLWIASFAAEPTSHPTSGQIESILAGFAAQLDGHANYVHRDALPVLMVGGNLLSDPCETSARWVSANQATGAPKVWLVLRGASDDSHLRCSDQPQAWYFLDSSRARVAIAGSFAVSPGRWDASDAAPTLPRDLSRFRADVQAMVDSGASIQLVSSFNNWQEGTAVESAQEWTSPSGFGQHLDALHELLPE